MLIIGGSLSVGAVREPPVSLPKRLVQSLPKEVAALATAAESARVIVELVASRA